MTTLAADPFDHPPLDAEEQRTRDLIFLSGMSELARATCVILRFEADGWRFDLCPDPRFVTVHSPSGRTYNADSESCSCLAGVHGRDCRHAKFVRFAGSVEVVREVLRRRI